jgi:hypothetical protein
MIAGLLQHSAGYHITWLLRNVFADIGVEGYLFPLIRRAEIAICKIGSYFS